MDWETIWQKILEFISSFVHYAMNEGENKFMLVNYEYIYSEQAPEGATYFFVWSFVVMALLAIFACDSFRLLHPIQGIKEWKTKISVVKVVFFAAAVFSFHTFYKKLITLTGGLFHAYPSIDTLKCLGTYINPISVMIYAFAVSTMNFRKGSRQAMFLGWAVFLTPAVMSYDAWTREHVTLYIAALTLGIAGAVLYKKHSPLICYFVLSALYFVCRFFMIYYSAEMLILTSDGLPGKIGQYFACAQMDVMLTLLLLLILFGYTEITAERGNLRLKRDTVFVAVTAAFMVCAIVSNQVVEVHAVLLEKEEPDIYVPEEDQDDETIVDKYILNNEPIIYFVVTTDTANIRLGPGTEYDVITSAEKETAFSGTGNEAAAKNGRIWYEIYINHDVSETGWASSTVMEKREFFPVNKLAGTWYGGRGSELTIEEHGICYYQNGSMGEGTWEVDDDGIIHIHIDTLPYEVYASLNAGYDTISMTMEADSPEWEEEVFTKQ